MGRCRWVPAFAVALLLLASVACGSDEEDTTSTTDLTVQPQAAVQITEPVGEPQTAATQTPEPETAAAFPYTVTGSDGQTIVFEEPPERIVAMDSAVVEILFAIGEGDRVVGTHDFVTYPPESTDIPRLGGAFDMNIEATVYLEPDLVVIFSDGLLEALRRVGLKVFYQKSLEGDVLTIAENVSMWGRITGAVEAAEQVALEFEIRVDAIDAKMAFQDSGPRVFQDEGGLWTPGPDTLIHEVFETLKLQNIAHDVSGYAQLSPEVIVERDPEIIIACCGDNISENTAFQSVTAVVNGRVYVPDSDALSIPGPRYVEGIEKLARWVYPDLFEQGNQETRGGIGKGASSR